MSDGKRKAYPWEDLPEDFYNYIPWEHQQWFPELTSGMWRSRQGDFEHDPRPEKRIVRSWQALPIGAPELTYDDMKKCRDVQKEHDCSFMEAVVSVVGRENLSGQWLKKAMRAPRTMYKHADAFKKVVEERNPEPEPVFNVPGEEAPEAPPQKRGPGRPPKSTTRPTPQGV
jgi:hypothetical protein